MSATGGNASSKSASTAADHGLLAYTCIWQAALLLHLALEPNRHFALGHLKSSESGMDCHCMRKRPRCRAEPSGLLESVDGVMGQKLIVCFFQGCVWACG